MVQRAWYLRKVFCHSRSFRRVVQTSIPWKYVLFYVVGSSTFAALGILVQLSKEPDGSYAYSMPAVIFIAETCKFIISCCLLARQQGSVVGVLNLLRRLRWQCFLFVVPSILYAINNNLDMVCNLFMDSATFQVVAQLKVLTTGLLWRIVFGCPLSSLKWFALLLLAFGSAFASWPSDSSKNTMHIRPMGAVLMVLYACSSALASVSTEYLYKRVGAAGSIHLQNMLMYFFGLLFNFLLLLLSHFNHLGEPVSLRRPLRGFNFWTCCMVVNYVIMGFLIAFVMKHFSTIHKLVISGSAMYLSALLTCLLFDLLPSRAYTVGLLFVTSGLAAFHFEDITRMIMSSVQETKFDIAEV